MLSDRQRQFATALLDATFDAPPDVIGPDGRPSLRRFNVYRNNVVVGLIEALQAAYPAVESIVGDEFFRAMARAFAVSRPPTSPVLLEYGGEFPQFIDTFGQANPLPYLADVARIERAWLEAYHAPEEKSLPREAFSAIPPEKSGEVGFALHPSLRIARSEFPALTIWRMNVQDGVPGPVDLGEGGQDVLIVRPGAEVEVRLMPPGGADFLDALSQGRSLGESAELAMRAHGFDLAANLAALISANVFTRFEFVPTDIGKVDHAIH